MASVSGATKKTWWLAVLMAFAVTGCSQVKAPDARNVDIPAPASADKRKRATNERPDSVMYLPLGEDVLVPETLGGDKFPEEEVGPFELRGETLAGALQLILAEYDISLAFETQEGLSRKITVANLKGNLGNVIERVCSLANLYCSFENNTITVKDTQTFTVSLPPIGQGDTPTAYMDNVAKGLAAIIGTSGTAPIVDPSTRTIVYTATARTAELAGQYFQRLRANTAMIVYETYIWEVSLNAGNSTGIDWDAIDTFGKFNATISLSGGAASDFTNPVSIGLPTTHTIGTTPNDLVEFLSQYGAVKTISQPQITVLSGSAAELKVADTQNYVSQISTTITDTQSTTSATTDSVDSGFTLNIASSWDKSTVYANIKIDLTNVLSIDDFTFSDGGAAGTSTSIQLPQTTQRQLTTQVRVRPGDSILIAGLVQEKDNFDSRGPGFMQPVIPDSRTAKTENLELVFLLRPRVVVYSTPEAGISMSSSGKASAVPDFIEPSEAEEPVGAMPMQKVEALPVGTAAAPTATPAVKSSSSSAEGGYKSVRPKISSRSYSGSDRPASSSRAAAPVASDLVADPVEIFDVSRETPPPAPPVVVSKSKEESKYKTYGSDNPSLYDSTEYKK